MRKLPLFLVGWACLARLACHAQTASDLFVSKSVVFSQIGAEAPYPRTTNAAIFEAGSPSFGAPFLTSGATLTLPGGTSDPMPLSGDASTYDFSLSFNSIADLDAAFPQGQYSVAVASTTIPGLSAAIYLPDDSFPAAPAVLNFDAAQSIDPTQDFTLEFAPFDGGADGDVAFFEIYEDGSLLMSFPLNFSDTNVLVSSRGADLAPATSYAGRLRFLHLVLVGATFPPAAYGFGAETWFPLATSSPANTSAPSLAESFPANNGTLAQPSGAVEFQFSEPMNTNRVDISWRIEAGGVINSPGAGEMAYFWSPDGLTLLCSDAPTAWGLAQWPAGAVVTWTLNPEPDGAANFADPAGNALPVAAYTGQFLVGGGPAECVAQAGNPVEAPAFYLSKIVNYTQTSDAAPSPDPRYGAQFVAYANTGGGPANSSFPPIVAVLLRTPSLTNLSFLSTVVPAAGSPLDLSRRMFVDTQYDRAALDQSYPAGSYTLELGTPNPTNMNLPFIVTNSVTIAQTNLGYPAIPQFANVAAVTNLAATNGLEFDWLPYAAATSNSFVLLSISDAASNVVFSAPNSCAGLALQATNTSIVVPANTLSNGRAYTVALTFGKLVDPLAYMGGVPGAGYSALERTTRLAILPGGSPLTPPLLGDVSFSSSGQIGFDVNCMAGAALVIEQSVNLTEGFFPVLTTNPPSSRITVTLPAGGSPTGFWRARYQ
jgi:hypothetical protein